MALAGWIMQLTILHTLTLSWLEGTRPTTVEAVVPDALAPLANDIEHAPSQLLAISENLMEGPRYLEGLQGMIADEIEDNDLDIVDLARAIWVHITRDLDACHWAVAAWTDDEVQNWYRSGRSFGAVLPANCYSAVPSNEAAFVTGGAALHLIQVDQVLHHVMVFFKPAREQFIAEPGQLFWLPYLQTFQSGSHGCVQAQLRHGGIIDLTDLAQCIRRYLMRQTYAPHRGILVLAVSPTRIGFEVPLGGLMVAWEEYHLPSQQEEEERRIVMHIMPPRLV